jgi:hypothetical protein
MFIEITPDIEKIRSEIKVDSDYKYAIDSFNKIKGFDIPVYLLNSEKYLKYSNEFKDKECLMNISRPDLLYGFSFDSLNMCIKRYYDCNICKNTLFFATALTFDLSWKDVYGKGITTYVNENGIKIPYITNELLDEMSKNEFSHQYKWLNMCIYEITIFN